MLKLQQEAEAAVALMRSEIRGGKQVDGLKKKTRKHHFSHERNTAFLWFILRGWSADAVAMRLNCSQASFYSFKRKLGEQPWILFDYPVLSRSLRGLVVIWTCEVCGAKFPKLTERKAREHVALHFLPRELTINPGLFREWYE